MTTRMTTRIEYHEDRCRRGTHTPEPFQNCFSPCQVNLMFFKWIASSRPFLLLVKISFFFSDSSLSVVLFVYPLFCLCFFYLLPSFFLLLFDEEKNNDGVNSLEAVRRSAFYRWKLICGVFFFDFYFPSF